VDTKKRFKVPDEAHPNRRKTIQAVYICGHCGYEGDFMFCPYCGVRRPCPTLLPDSSPKKT